MRTNRPTHHLIVQSQRKRRPGQHHRVELRIVEARRQHADIRNDLDSSRLEVGEDALALLFRRILRHDSRHTRQAVGNVLSLLHEPGEQQYAPTIHPKKPPNDIQHSVVEAHAPILALHGVVRIVGPGRIPVQPVQIDQRDAVVVQLGQIPLPEQIADLHEEQQAREDARAGIRDKAQDRAVSRRIQAVRRSRQADDLTPDRLEEVAVHSLLRIDQMALVHDHIPEVRELLDVVLHAADCGKGDTGDSLAIAGGRVDRAFEDVVCAELRVVLLQYLLARLEHQHRSAEPSGDVGNDQTLAAARRKNHNTVGRSGAILEIPHRYVGGLLLIWTKPVHGLFFLKRFVAIVADLRVVLEIGTLAVAFGHILVQKILLLLLAEVEAEHIEKSLRVLVLHVEQFAALPLGNQAHVGQLELSVRPCVVQVMVIHRDPVRRILRQIDLLAAGLDLFDQIIDAGQGCLKAFLRVLDALFGLRLDLHELRLVLDLVALHRLRVIIAHRLLLVSIEKADDLRPGIQRDELVGQQLLDLCQRVGSLEKHFRKAIRRFRQIELDLVRNVVR